MSNYKIDEIWHTDTKWVCTYFINSALHTVSFTCKEPGYDAARNYVQDVIIPYHYPNYNKKELRITLLPSTYVTYDDEKFYGQDI